MAFNFNTFSAFARMAYDELAYSPYSFEDVLKVFHEYFWKYKHFRKTDHPIIKSEQINHIIKIMPYFDDSPSDYDDDEIDIEPQEYRAMIQRHFETQYKNCDYNINHFFSGKIRRLRFYETYL